MDTRDDLERPILAHKRYDAPSAFTPQSLLRAARRQRGLPVVDVPAVCLLDPDGDIVRHLKSRGRATLDANWCCYHTELYRCCEAGAELGIIGCAVGAAFAVLVAEELFASGCRLLVSMTSAGQLAASIPPPYFILIDRALRDEGTSYHYLPPSQFSRADPAIVDALTGAFDHFASPVIRGATWTTDAPFRETQEAIDHMCAQGLLAVEMEAAGLYAFAQACNKDVLCFAHVTNQMGRSDEDFEKGEANGTINALRVVGAAVERLRSRVTGLA